jgi:hypothetical protein
MLREDVLLPSSGSRIELTKETACTPHNLLAWLTVLNLKMEAVCTSEILVQFCHIAWHNIPEDSHCCENLHLTT